MAKLSVDDKLGFTKFSTDEYHPHITINEDCTDETLMKRLVMACPAGLYRYSEGKLIFSHEGCFECGTCRVLAGGRAVKSWCFPQGSMGVEYRQG